MVNKHQASKLFQVLPEIADSQVVFPSNMLGCGSHSRIAAKDAKTDPAPQGNADTLTPTQRNGVGRANLCTAPGPSRRKLQIWERLRATNGPANHLSKMELLP